MQQRRAILADLPTSGWAILAEMDACPASVEIDRFWGRLTAGPQPGGATPTGARVRVTTRVGSAMDARVWTVLTTASVPWTWAGTATWVRLEAAPLTAGDAVRVQGVLLGGCLPALTVLPRWNRIGSLTTGKQTAPRTLGTLQSCAKAVEVTASAPGVSTVSIPVLGRRSSDGAWVKIGAISVTPTLGGSSGRIELAAAEIAEIGVDVSGLGVGDSLTLVADEEVPAE